MQLPIKGHIQIILETNDLHVIQKRKTKLYLLSH